MTKFSPALWAVPVIVAAMSGAASAEVDLAQVDTCLSEGSQPATCIELALAGCAGTVSDTPAVATLCFVQAETVWNTAIGDTMARLVTAVPEEITAIAGIEVKYDLLSARLQCSRLEELSLAVGRDSGPAIQRRDAQCKANAAGLSYARLVQRSSSLR